MDFQICFGLSLVETLITSALSPTHEAFSDLPTSKTLLFLGFFSAQWALIKFYRVFIYPYFVSPLRGIPGPKDNHFFIGQLLHLYRAATPIDQYMSWSATWPESPFIRYPILANKEILLINTIEAHKQVLQTKCYDFVKPKFLERLLGEIVGTGLLFAENHEHKKQRRMILNVFSVPNMKKLIPVFQQKAEEMTVFIERKIKENGTKNLEVQKIFTKATLDAIGVAALGIELENLRSEELKLDFLQCYIRMLSQPPVSALISFIHVHIPIRRFIPLEANWGFMRAMRGVHSMLNQCIEERIRDLKSTDREKVGGTESRDLLTYMIEERELQKEELTIADIRGHLQNFLSAGHETTSGALTWASYVLATRPDIQDRLRDEVVQNLGTFGIPTYNEIEKLSYLKDFLQEVLRVYTPAPATWREAAKDVTICGQFLPKGTQLVLSPPVTNLSPRIWGPDAREFIPERWESLTDDATTPYATQTFGNGPRICIGKSYSLLAFKVMMIELLRSFRFSRSPQLEALGDGPVPVQNPAVTWRPKGGMTVHLEKITWS
ncbi:cytochrome P450 [Annulohypoxylon maeteangense]|uniref:cytochrome P450 n=1 Tax=Annulohypoxylon maeteangense TaxID=1927788 RepID=UPI002008B624|nr:cytochrome P450 [Annulohypoxylon maeteangense]KAI0886959.1 cytochrome P450 [Annulohypoxylon maeteangense]